MGNNREQKWNVQIEEPESKGRAKKAKKKEGKKGFSLGLRKLTFILEFLENEKTIRAFGFSLVLFSFVSNDFIFILFFHGYR